MDRPTEHASNHDLLLALAGLIDDDLLGWARELVAVGEESRAITLLTAAIAAERTALPAPVRAAVVAAGRSVRMGVDLGTLAAAGEEIPHRFAAAPAGVPDVAGALAALPPRQLQDTAVHLTWRLTPAGTAPGPLPHPVVLIEADRGAHAAEMLAYQVAAGLDRAGFAASVEVLATGRPRSAYHEAALRNARPVTVGAAPGPAGGSTGAVAGAAGPAGGAAGLAGGAAGPTGGAAGAEGLVAGTTGLAAGSARVAGAAGTADGAARPAGGAAGLVAGAAGLVAGAASADATAPALDQPDPASPFAEVGRGAGTSIAADQHSAEATGAGPAGTPDRRGAADAEPGIADRADARPGSATDLADTDPTRTIDDRPAPALPSGNSAAEAGGAAGRTAAGPGDASDRRRTDWGSGSGDTPAGPDATTVADPDFATSGPARPGDAGPRAADGLGDDPELGPISPFAPEAAGPAAARRLDPVQPHPLADPTPARPLPPPAVPAAVRPDAAAPHQTAPHHAASQEAAHPAAPPATAPHQAASQQAAPHHAVPHHAAPHHATEDEPALAALSDPLMDPIDEPLLAPLLDPTIHEHDPLGVDHLVGPRTRPGRPAEPAGSGPEPSELGPASQERRVGAPEHGSGSPGHLAGSLGRAHDPADREPDRSSRLLPTGSEGDAPHNELTAAPRPGGADIPQHERTTGAQSGYAAHDEFAAGPRTSSDAAHHQPTATPQTGHHADAAHDGFAATSPGGADAPHHRLTPDTPRTSHTPMAPPSAPATPEQPGVALPAADAASHEAAEPPAPAAPSWVTAPDRPAAVEDSWAAEWASGAWAMSDEDPGTPDARRTTGARPADVRPGAPGGTPPGAGESVRPGAGDLVDPFDHGPGQHVTPSAPYRPGAPFDRDLAARGPADAFPTPVGPADHGRGPDRSATADPVDRPAAGRASTGAPNAHDRTAPDARPAAEAYDRAPATDDRPAGEAPEQPNRLSDADRELLARLQAELAEGRKPRVIRRPAAPGRPSTNGHGPDH